MIIKSVIDKLPAMMYSTTTASPAPFQSVHGSWSQAQITLTPVNAQELHQRTTLVQIILNTCRQ